MKMNPAQALMRDSLHEVVRRAGPFAARKDWNFRSFLRFKKYFTCHFANHLELVTGTCQWLQKSIKGSGLFEAVSYGDHQFPFPINF